MSMFNWAAAPGERVVSQRFWVYWAFTIPITIIIVVAFNMFVLVHIEGDRPETKFEGFKRRQTERLSEQPANPPGRTRKLNNLFSSHKTADDVANGGAYSGV